MSIHQGQGYICFGAQGKKKKKAQKTTSGTRRRAQEIRHQKEKHMVKKGLGLSGGARLSRIIRREGPLILLITWKVKVKV